MKEAGSDDANNKDESMMDVDSVTQNSEEGSSQTSNDDNSHSGDDAVELPLDNEELNAQRVSTHACQ